jgi:hypothetical protein
VVRRMAQRGGKFESVKRRKLKLDEAAKTAVARLRFHDIAARVVAYHGGAGFFTGTSVPSAPKGAGRRRLVPSSYAN